MGMNTPLNSFLISSLQQVTAQDNLSRSCALNARLIVLEKKLPTRISHSVTVLGAVCWILAWGGRALDSISVTVPRTWRAANRPSDNRNGPKSKHQLRCPSLQCRSSS